METQATPVASLGMVLGSAWRTTRANLWSIAAITLAISVPINAILELVPLAEDAGLREWSHYFRIQRALQFWVGTIGILGVVHLVVGTHRGTRLSIGEAFGRAFGSYGSALWAQFLYKSAYILGTLLLVVPGIAVGVYWFFALQVIVIHEKSGWSALKHSYCMVKGRWWPFLGRLAALYVLMIVGIIVLSVPGVFMPETYLLNLLTWIPIDLLLAFFIVCFTELWLLSEPREETTATAERGKLDA